MLRECGGGGAEQAEEERSEALVHECGGCSECEMWVVPTIDGTTVHGEKIANTWQPVREGTAVFVRRW